MSDTMRLSLKDFGPIDTAEIDIGKITVIGGENATGKSTTSKILYCFSLLFLHMEADSSFHHPD